VRHYEIVFLIHPDQTDQVPAMIGRYEAVIAKHHGKVHRKEDWGRRQLAYSINDLHKAHYVLLNIECNQATLDELANAFKFNDAILRHSILKQREAVTTKSAMLQTETSPVERS